MTAKTTTNRNFPIPNLGGLRPACAVVFKSELLIMIQVPAPGVHRDNADNHYVRHEE
jgi:hypothetical protein